MRVEEGDMESVLKYIKAEQAKEKKLALAAKKKREAAAAAALERERLKEEKENEKRKKKQLIDSDIRFSAEKNVRAQRRDQSGKAPDLEKEVSSKTKSDRGKIAKFGEDDEDDLIDNEKDVEKDTRAKKIGADDDEEDEEEAEDLENDPDLEDFKKYVNVEMSAGWIMIPIRDTLQKTKPGKGTKLTLDMNGGTPFSLVGIQRSDVPNRKGLLEAIKRVVGMKINSKLQLLIAPIAAPVAKKNQPIPVSNTAILPRDIILPTKTVDVITTYRQIIASETHLPTRNSKAVALPYGNAIFSSFPRILNDPAAQRVLLLLWSLKAPPIIKKSPPVVSATNPHYVAPERLDVFNDVVLKVWHAMSCYNDKRSRLEVDESLDSIYARELHLRNLVGIYVKDGKAKKSSTDITTATQSATATATASGKRNGNTKDFTNNNPNIQRTSNFGVNTTGMSKGKSKGKGDGPADLLSDEDLPQPDYKPFNVKELLWGVEQEF